jgi:hypothetical protein
MKPNKHRLATNDRSLKGSTRLPRCRYTEHVSVPVSPAMDIPGSILIKNINGDYPLLQGPAAGIRLSQDAIDASMCALGHCRWAIDDRRLNLPAQSARRLHSWFFFSRQLREYSDTSTCLCRSSELPNSCHRGLFLIFSRSILPAGPILVAV